MKCRLSSVQIGQDFLHAAQGRAQEFNGIVDDPCNCFTTATDEAIDNLQDGAKQLFSKKASSFHAVVLCLLGVVVFVKVRHLCILHVA